MTIAVVDPAFWRMDGLDALSRKPCWEWVWDIWIISPPAVEEGGKRIAQSTSNLAKACVGNEPTRGVYTIQNLEQCSKQIIGG